MVLAVLVSVGSLVLVAGWKMQQRTYQQTFEELLHQAYLVEPVFRAYLAGGMAAEPLEESCPDSWPRVERSFAGASLGGPSSLETGLPSIQRTIQELCLQMGRASQTRITLILPDGTVLGESEEKPDLMEPHGSRPEIAQALEGRPGTSLRYSHTLRQWMFYAAVPIGQGERTLGVLRLARPKELVDRQLWRFWLWLGGAAGVLAGLAIGMGVWLERPVRLGWQKLLEGAKRLAQGDGTVRMVPEGPEDLRQLADCLCQLADTLQSRLYTLQAQQSELQAILSSMNEGVLAVDCQRRLLCLNPAAGQLLGLQVGSPEGRLLEEICRYPEVHHLVDQVLGRGETIVHEIQLPGPPPREVQLQATVLQTSDHHPIGALVVLRDVTRLKQLEDLRREFVANVSHELKTPLTSIQGFVETLLDGALHDPPQAERFLKIIATQTQRLQNLLEDLLSLSRIEQEAEAQQIRLEPGPIRDVLQSAMELCRPKAEEKQIRIQLDCPEDLEAPRNPALLEQAVVNLLDNAIKYSPEGQIVHLEAGQEGQEVVIRVRDYGCGIPPEHLDRIFERFYRVDKARSRKLGGTGLGLAIVKHIALAHGGRVEVQSQVGRGSSFFIYLPIARQVGVEPSERS